MSPILSLILHKLQEKTIIAPFVILYGPWVDAQWSPIRESCQTATGFFAYHDILDIKDYTSLLGKSHTLKVEYKKTEDSDLLNKQEWYEDKWAREINEWLSTAPAGDLKILMIEHIDRATLWAANALLKSFEEPLSHRIIIASTTNKDTILPTVLSRALLIHCDADYSAATLDEEWKQLLSDIVGALDRKDIAILTKWASKIAKWNLTIAFVDNLINHYSIAQQYDKIPVTITTLRMISSNVSAEHGLFKLFLELMK